MRKRFAAQLTAAFLMAELAYAGRHLVAQPGEEVSGALIVKMRAGVRMSGAKVPARFLRASRWGGLSLPGYHRVQIDVSDHLAAGAALADDPAVEFVEPDRIRRGSIALPNDSNFGQQWNLTKVRALQAWQWFPGRYSTSSTNLDRVRVAVLDSGADCTHPDFANTGNASTDSASGGQLNWARSLAIRATNVASPACPWQDDLGHGTLVSGVVAAASNNQRGLASLGYMLELVTLKVSSNNEAATDSTLVQAITHAVDNGARVINMSLSAAGYGQALQDAIDYAWQRNVIVIAAVGNSGKSTSEYPAASNHVVGVGAIDTDGAVASFSTRGTSVDMVAPGVSILSTSPVSGGTYTSSYATVSGTSFAAPHVAALAGLLAMVSPGVQGDEVVRRMQLSADAQGGWSAELGYGRIDAERAVTGTNWRASSTGGVSGQIQDSTGLPIALATVTVASNSITTDSTGLFRFTGVAPGDYTMSVTLPSQTAISAPITISVGAETPTQLRLGSPHGTLRGTVTAGGVAAAGIVVTAWRDGTLRAVAVTNSNGQYRLFGPAGIYEVRAGGMFTTLAVATNQSIAAGSVTDALPLAAQNFGRLEGAVRDSRNATVAAAQVLVTQPGRSLGAESGAAGDYRTLAAPAGNYQVSGEETSTGIAQPTPVSIANNTNTRFDVVLRNDGATSVSPTLQTYSALGEEYARAEVTSAAYIWRATTSTPWLHLTASIGRGNGSSVGYTVDPNPTTTAREGRISVNEATLTVRQSAATDLVTLAPSTFTARVDGDVFTFSISTSGSWVAVSEADWLVRRTFRFAGSGNGTQEYLVAANPLLTARTGRIRVNASYVTVTQPGAPVALSPASVIVGAASFAGTIAVTAASPSTSWSAQASPEWITIIGSASGIGNGTLNYRLAANTDNGRGGRIVFNGVVSFSVQQNEMPISVSPASVAASPSGESGTVNVTARSDEYWSASTDASWIGLPLRSGYGNGGVNYQVVANPSSNSRAATVIVVAAGGTTAQFTITQAGAGPAAVQLTPTSANMISIGGIGSFTVVGGSQWTAVSNAGWISIGATSGNTVTYGVAANPNGQARTGTISVGSSLFTITQQDAAGVPTSGLHFVPVQPCRVVDTRTDAGQFGKPALAAGAARSFVVPSSACGIPASAKAYALNVTVVPAGPLGYVTIFPTGQTQPLVSTLNSIDGRIKANAAIVPAGTGGAISIFATNATELVLDINGYFIEPGTSAEALAFYPVAPCRVLDTRNPNGSLGGPILAANVARSFPLLNSTCGIPANARAYSTNATVVPSSPLGYLTLWPSGRTQPLVSTLNAPTGAVVANAAILPAGDSGAISAYATSASHLIIDINGYFAPPAASAAQRFYPVSPCRVLDSRNPDGGLGGPAPGANQTRTWPLPSSACGLPASATAYSLNATVVPTVSLGYLTMWPAGQTQPLVSTLNAIGDPIVANAAIVPAGTAGSIATFVTNETHLILDTNGYFAP